MIILEINQKQFKNKCLIIKTKYNLLEPPEAVEVALEEATKTIRGITGLEVVSKTATVDPNNDIITKYDTTIKLSFGVER